MKILRKNENRPFYDSVHYWLKYNYGRASKCENKKCPQVSKKFDWAKKFGKSYEYKRTNFFQLCHSCHKKYDVTDEFRALMRNNNFSKQTHCKVGHPLFGDNLYKYRQGRHCMACRREKLRLWRKNNPQKAKEQDKIKREKYRERMLQYAREYYWKKKSDLLIELNKVK